MTPDSTLAVTKTCPKDGVHLLLGYVLAVLAGFTLMVIGLGLGVTMIMLPAGLVVGLVGVLLFVWGLVGHLEDRR